MAGESKENLSSDEKLVRVAAGLAKAMVEIEERDKQIKQLEAAREADEVEKAELREKAYTDSATEVANRRSLDEKGPELIRIAKANKEPLAAFLLDANYLKMLNEQEGFEAGTELLRAIARGLDSTSFATDIVARLGGDEFMFLATGFRPKAGYTQDELLDEYSGIIEAEVSADIKRRKLPKYAGASIGSTVLDLDDPNENMSSLLGRVDRSSKEDKARRKEKDSIEYFDDRKIA